MPSSSDEIPNLDYSLVEELAIARQQLIRKDAEIDRMKMLVEQTIIESEKMKQEYEEKILEQVRSYEKRTEDWNMKIKEFTLARQQDNLEKEELSRIGRNFAREWHQASNELLNEKNRVEILRDTVDRKNIELERNNIRLEHNNTQLEQKQSEILNLTNRLCDLEIDKKKDEEETKRVMGMLEEYKQECSRVTGTPQQFAERIEWYASRLEKVEKENEEMRAAQKEPRYPIPICQICRFEFDESPERTPHVLECGHTVCKGCAEKLMIDKETDAKRIKCPFDRQITYSDLEFLPKNFTIMDYICNC